MGVAAVGGRFGVAQSCAATCHHTPSRGAVRYNMLCMLYIAAGGQVGVLQQVQPLQQIPQITPQQLQAMMASGQALQLTPQQLQTITKGYTPQQQAQLMQQLQLRAAQPRPPQPGMAAQPRPQVQLAYPIPVIPPPAVGRFRALLRCSAALRPPALLARRPSQRRL